MLYLHMLVHAPVSEYMGQTGSNMQISDPLFWQNCVDIYKKHNVSENVDQVRICSVYFTEDSLKWIVNFQMWWMCWVSHWHIIATRGMESSVERLQVVLKESYHRNGSVSHSFETSQSPEVLKSTWLMALKSGSTPHHWVPNKQACHMWQLLCTLISVLHMYKYHFMPMSKLLALSFNDHMHEYCFVCSFIIYYLNVVLHLFFNIHYMANSMWIPDQ